MNAVYPDEEVIDKAYAQAEKLAQQPPASVRLTKALLKGSISGRVADAMTEEMKHFTERLSSAECAEALEQIGRLKNQKLLNGFRGFPAVDRDVLADIFVRLGDLAVAFDQIKEVDINPLIVSEGKPIAVDATIIFEKKLE